MLLWVRAADARLGCVRTPVLMLTGIYYFPFSNCDISFNEGGFPQIGMNKILKLLWTKKFFCSCEVLVREALMFPSWFHQLNSDNATFHLTPETKRWHDVDLSHRLGPGATSYMSDQTCPREEKTPSQDLTCFNLPQKFTAASQPTHSGPWVDCLATLKK